MQLDLGLLGATSIAERAVLGPASRLAGVAVRAVAASDRERARDFGARNGIARVHADYQSLIRDPDVNAVYVSLHNSAHHSWAVRAAAEGKHVLVEKPLCLDEEQLHDIRAACRAGGVQVAEAVITAGHPWMAAVRDIIARVPHGALRTVRTSIRFRPPVPGSYRTRPELGGGIFTDCASYWLQVVQATVGLTGAHGTGHRTDHDDGQADRSFHAELHWPDGVTAVLECETGERHHAVVEFVFETASVVLRHLLRPAAAPLPLNLLVRHCSGETRVSTFPPVGYYEAQLARFRDLCSGTGTGDGIELASAAPRIAMMAGIRSGFRTGTGGRGAGGPNTQEPAEVRLP